MSEPLSNETGENEAAPESVEQWLVAIGFPQFAESFRANNITWEVLPTLSEADLKSLGVEAVGFRKILLHKIRERFPSVEPAADAGATAFPDIFPVAELETSMARAVSAAQSYLTEVTPASQDALGEIGSSLAPLVLPPVSSASMEAPAQPRRTLWQKLLASKILLWSIILHVLFGAGATAWIVQNIQAKRKVTFQAPSGAPNPSTRALEHKVNMTRKQ